MRPILMGNQRRQGGAAVRTGRAQLGEVQYSKRASVGIQSSRRHGPRGLQRFHRLAWLQSESEPKPGPLGRNVAEKLEYTFNTCSHAHSGHALLIRIFRTGETRRVSM